MNVFVVRGEKGTFAPFRMEIERAGKMGLQERKVD